MRYLLPAVVTAAIAVLAVAASAVAAPFTVGSGARPRVAVDAAGTAYVAWTEEVTGNGAADDVTHFCSVPRGAAACAAGSQRSFAPNPGPNHDGDSNSGPAVFVSGATVIVWLDRGSSATANSVSYVAVSTNRGASFAPLAIIGSQGTFSTGDVIALPSGAIAVIDSIHTFGDRFQREPLTGTAPTAQTVANLGDNGSSFFEGQSALASFGTSAQDRLLAVMGNVAAVDTLAFRTYLGTGGNANTLAAWSPLRVVGPGRSPRLCGGAGGVVLTNVARPQTSDVLQRRVYNPATNSFGVPVTIATGPTVDRQACGHDAAGNLTIVYWVGSGQRLWSSATGQSAALNSETPNPLASVAVAPDGGGWLAYANDTKAIRLQPLSDAASPALGKVVVVGRVSGTVKVRVRGSRRFTTLQAGQGVPPGSEIDTTKGTVAVTSAKNARGARQTAQFRSGRFAVTQTRRSALTTARLTGAETKSCPKAGGASGAAKSKRRRLFGSGKGSFRTQGHYGTASIRGTKWLVEDFCDRTKITDIEGTVVVRDLVKRKTVRLKKGQSYTAFAPRRR